MKLKSDELLKHVYNMRSDKRAQMSQSSLEIKYKILSEDYPYLFKMVSENSDDFMDILKKMITLMQMVEDGTKTQEDSDKIMGYELAKTFVYEKLDMTKEVVPAMEPIFDEIPDGGDDSVLS
jgi:hypothetical protein